MICSADDLLEWKDFPKGLRVLLLDEDSVSAAEIKPKLEEMDYIVSTFCTADEALIAISSEHESFHVAIVEVSTSSQQDCFKFLESAEDLPTIISKGHECLGAAEFLQKPLSEDKLRNIWQHVVHKAFNAKDSALSKPVKPFNDMLQLQQETNEDEDKKLMGIEISAYNSEFDHEQSTVSDKFQAPSTPQLKQGCRFLDDGQSNCSLEKEHGDLEGESKSVETTCNNSVAETTCDNSVEEVSVMVDPSLTPKEVAVKEENSVERSRSGNSLSCHPQKVEKKAESKGDNPRIEAPNPNSCGRKTNRKIKVDWTPELHKRFVQAVEQLGVDQAIPSRILDLMKVEGLTRHNVASHLQKYRMHRRHIVPKDDDRRWQHPRGPTPRVYPHKPIMAYPPYHTNHSFTPNQFYPVWGHPSNHHSSMQMWGHPGFPTWHPQDSWSWNTHPWMHADAWGRPMMPPSPGPCSNFPQNASGFHSLHPFEECINSPSNSFDFHPAEELIDKVVREAVSKPWLPLPLGLKPPSTESVLSELHRQGICNIPPPPTHHQC
ncbi:hypothetical protein IFM89_027634 [Coptis chinensis]|uniref:Two-component response regulator-like APRR2 n=1 Tax=Coptis chinensis TaxID=261450 RepID=A0A835J082_9MAGN|nr:hypothetical protein IFM89_027634 [Coptis chinensis]